MDLKPEITALAEEFCSCRKLLQALGDENRQHLILEMMQMGQCNGVRVGAITERTHLSRPAVSHHLRILREAGLVQMRREGTRNHYYFDVHTASVGKLQEMLAHITEVAAQLPDRTVSKQERAK